MKNETPEKINIFKKIWQKLKETNSKKKKMIPDTVKPMPAANKKMDRNRFHSFLLA